VNHDDELMRAVTEGMAALKKARERLTSNPHKPPDWEKITPKTLKRAVEHVRKEFRRSEWQLASRIECGCYFSLHPELVTQPKFKAAPNPIPIEGRLAWQVHFQGMTEPECFAHWVEQFSESLKEKVIMPFNSFLRIGLAQQSRLSLPAVEWARTSVDCMLYSLEWTVPQLIKRMCDEQENRLEINMETLDPHCGWVYWRAPRFVYMQPWGNLPYDPTTAWEREPSANRTEEVLRGLTSKMLDPARFKLDRLAGEAHVSLACAPFPSAGTRDRNSTSQQARTDAGREMNVSSSVPNGEQDELPAKKADLSRYMDQAELTERQRECFSLKFEYGLAVIAIAERLHIHRKTVDEHIEAANRRMQIAKLRDKGKDSRNRLSPAD
jgi:DNA-binding CsgD family transcriptional regulator